MDFLPVASCLAPHHVHCTIQATSCHVRRGRLCLSLCGRSCVSVMLMDSYPLQLLENLMETSLNGLSSQAP